MDVAAVFGVPTETEPPPPPVPPIVTRLRKACFGRFTPAASTIIVATTMLYTVSPSPAEMDALLISAVASPDALSFVMLR